MAPQQDAKPIVDAKPMVIVVMGVTGCGKTTVGRRLAERLGLPFQDADSLHPSANVAKMSAGLPLSDEDRRPWLEAVAAWIDASRAAGTGGVVACSALRRAYRRVLVGDRTDVRLVHLHGDRDTLETRLAGRRDHFMPASLLPSQLATLEPPGADERPITIDIGQPVERIIAEVVAVLAPPGSIS